MKITYAIFKLVTKELLEPNDDPYSKRDFYSATVPLMEHISIYDYDSKESIYDYATHEEAVAALQALYDAAKNDTAWQTPTKKANMGQYVIMPLYNIL